MQSPGSPDWEQIDSDFWSEVERQLPDQPLKVARFRKRLREQHLDRSVYHLPPQRIVEAIRSGQAFSQPESLGDWEFSQFVEHVIPDRDGNADEDYRSA